MPPKHGAERAAADLVVQRVLAELLGLEGRLARFLVKAPRNPHQHKHGHRAGGQQPKQEPESQAHDAHGSQRLRHVNLRDQAHVKLRQPPPRPNHPYAAIIAIPARIEPVLPGERFAARLW